MAVSGPVPIAALYDFLAAFPSVAHDRVRLLFDFYPLPEGLRCTLRSFYEAAEVMAARDPAVLLYIVTAGVIQGCP